MQKRLFEVDEYVRTLDTHPHCFTIFKNEGYTDSNTIQPDSRNRTGWYITG
jgi:hypothetical protein